MKIRRILLIISILFFTSCIVKSLHPFYTKDSLSFNEKLIGNWIDNKDGEWSVESFLDVFNKDYNKGEKLSEEAELILDRYHKGYVVTYLKKDKEAQFVVMPFKIENQYFLDFMPVEYDESEINSLAASHLLKTHSVAKLDFNSDKNATLSWLSEERIGDLIEQHKIRISHLITEDFHDTLLLTASSKELYEFLKKYLNSNIEDKWKDSDRLTLTKSNAKSKL